MLTESDRDDEQIIQRVAAPDIGKVEIVCCVRLPAAGDGKRRVQEVSTHSTMVPSLCELANRLVELGVTRVVMEATSDYWRPPFYLFEAHGLDPWLVNAKDVKHLPGRPKTDRLDAVWLCKVAERQMLRPSFVPPADIRRLRDLTRYRVDLVGVRTAEKNRVEKLLEDACLKLSVVASDIFGVSGRAMLTALIGGERDPKVLAAMARARMRIKIPRLEEAFAGLTLGTFDDHHRFLLERMLARVDAVTADIADLDTEIGDHLAPFADAVARLDRDPRDRADRGRCHHRRDRLGHEQVPHPRPSGVVGEVRARDQLLGRQDQRQRLHRPRRTATSPASSARPPSIAGRTDTFLGARYRRIARRRGKKKAIVAIGRSILVIIWHLLADPDASFHELGADHYDRHVNTGAKRRTHIRQLEALGYKVTLEPAA